MLEGPITVGDHFIWEPTQPHAYERIVVTELYHNPDTGTLWIKAQGARGAYWNEEPRFREACVREGDERLRKE